MSMLPVPSPFRPAAVLAAFSRGSEAPPDTSRGRVAVIDDPFQRTAAQALVQVLRQPVTGAAGACASGARALLAAAGLRNRAATSAGTDVAPEAGGSRPTLASHFDLAHAADLDRLIAPRERIA